MMGTITGIRFHTEIWEAVEGGGEWGPHSEGFKIILARSGQTARPVAIVQPDVADLVAAAPILLDIVDQVLGFFDQFERQCRREDEPELAEDLRRVLVPAREAIGTFKRKGVPG